MKVMEGRKMEKWMLMIGLLQYGAYAQGHEIAVTLQGMTPHLGQLFKARLVEIPSGVQRAETTLTSIGSANILLKFTGKAGIAYKLDYFADANGDKTYSAPPLDHAWRKDVPAVHHGGVALTFAHDVNFTDVNYPNTGSFVRSLSPSGRKGASREMRILFTPLSKISDPDLDGFTLMGARASASSRKILLLPRVPDKRP